MALNVNPVDSTNVQAAAKNSSDKLIEEIKVFPTVNDVADIGLGAIATHMRAANYRKEVNLPFGFSSVVDGYALAKGTAEQVEYNIEKVVDTFRMLFDSLLFKKTNEN